MSDVKTVTHIEELQTDPNNANIGTLRGSQLLEKSFSTYGAGRSILVDRQGLAIAGSKSLEMATEQGLPVKVVQSRGDKLVVVQRIDLDLTDPHTRALAYLDNRASEMGLEWDGKQLEQDLSRGVPFGAMFSQEELDALLVVDEAIECQVTHHMEGESQKAQWDRFIAEVDRLYPEIPRYSRVDYVPGARVDAWVKVQLQRLADEPPAEI